MRRFILSPTTKNILEGRGMKLYCSAPHCLVAAKEIADDDVNDADVENHYDVPNAIRVKAYTLCTNPVCRHHTPYGKSVFYDEKAIIDYPEQYVPENAKKDIKCEICGCRAEIKWSQNVVSKHLRNSHKFYHDICYNSLFFESPD